MNRQQRRQAAKQTPAYRRGMGAEALIREMSKNGITPDQYDAWGEKQYEKGWHEGFTAAGEEITKCIYATACLTLKELYGFGAGRCLKFLQLLDEKFLTSLHSSEEIDEVYKQLGLTIDFHEPLERVKEV
jgi:hypothetical protein